jgi:hypothetical protein
LRGIVNRARMRAIPRALRSAEELARAAGRRIPRRFIARGFDARTAPIQGDASEVGGQRSKADLEAKHPGAADADNRNEAEDDLQQSNRNAADAPDAQQQTRPMPEARSGHQRHGKHQQVIDAVHTLPLVTSSWKASCAPVPAEASRHSSTARTTITASDRVGVR